MLTDMEIRAAQACDEAALAAFYLQARQHAGLQAPQQALALDDFAAHTLGERVWLAHTPAGAVAGFISLWEPDDFIHLLYVGAPYQGCGLGSALLQALPDWPQRPYRLKCLAHNLGALAFYRARSFSVVGEGTSPDGDYWEMRSGGVRPCG